MNRADQAIEEAAVRYFANISPNLRPGAICKSAVSVNESERSVTGIITAETVDRDKEIVVTGGLDLKGFRKNPIVLFMHDPFGVVGKSAWQKLEGGKQAKPPPLEQQRDRERAGRDRHRRENILARRMLAKTMMAETDLAQEVYTLSKGGFLRGFSIGMLPSSMKGEVPTPAEIRKNPDWADAKAIIRKAELIEYSFVSIPANADAMTTAVGKGLIKHTEPYLEPFIRAVVDNQPRKRFVRIVPEVKVVQPKRVVVARVSEDDIARKLARQRAYGAGRI